MPDEKDPMYDADETRDLLGRAARLQHAKAADEAEAGLTLDEIQAAAASAGIDPQYVVEAARLDRPGTSGFFGPPATYDVSMTLDGVVPSAVFPTLRQQIRQAMGHDFGDAPRVPGQHGAGVERFTWDHGTLEHIALDPTPDGKTEVTARARWSMIRALMYGSGVVGGLIAGATLGAVLGFSGFLGYGVTVVGVGVGVLAGRGLWRRWATRARARLDAAVKSVVTHAAGALERTPPAATQSATQAAAPSARVSLPEADTSSPEALPAPERGRTGSGDQPG